MARPKTPENLLAELRLIELQAKAQLADRRLWQTAQELLDSRRLTVAQLAGALGLTERTAARRLAHARAGQGSPQATP